MNNSKVAVAVSRTVSLIQMLAGIAILFFFGLSTIIYLTDKEWAVEMGVAFFVFVLAFDALGIWLMILSRKKTKLIKEFKKYVTAISRDPNGFIPDIAASLGTSEDKVKSNLELMIKKKFFSNAFIDQNSNCIIIANRQVVAANSVPQAYTNTANTTNNFATPSAYPAVEMITVKCKGCGGVNTIPMGQVGECEYCGSPIKGE